MRATLFSNFGDDPVFVTQLLEEVAIPEYVCDLAELEAKPNAALAHKLKGSYRIIHFSQAGEAAFRIETLLKGVPAAVATAPDNEVEGLLAEVAKLRRCQALLEEAVVSGWFNGAGGHVCEAAMRGSGAQQQQEDQQ